MKNNNFSKEKGYFKRLENESLILSCLGGLSSKLIYFLKVSILSFFLSRSDDSDKLLNESATHKGIKQIELKKKIITPAKRFCNYAIETSPVVNGYKKLIGNAVYTPVSTLGAFFVTFGIYVGLIYFLKLYAFGNEDLSIYSLITGCLIILASFPMLFSRKTLIKYVESSAFIRAAFRGCIPFSSYDDTKKRPAFGTAFVFGSLFGVLTLFFNELRVLLFILVILFGLVVLYAPEIGLCTAALCLAFVPKVHLISLICYTFCCYLIKVVRGKRNLHIDSGSVFVLFLFACFGFNAIKGGGENALFAFSAVAVYIMAANLLATEKLLKKCIQALCLGLGGVVAVYLFQLLVGAYNGVAVLDVLAGSCSVFENSGSLIIFCVALLPFQFCKAGLSTPFSRPLCYILTAAIMCYSVYTGHVFYAVATAIAVTLFLSVNLRSVFIPLLLCVAVPLLTLYFSGISIDLGDMGIYNTVSGWVSAIKTSLQSPIFGLGMSAETLSVAAVADSHSMYFQTLVECGITGLVLLTLALVFSGQKLYTALPRVNKDGRRIAAAAGASSITAMLFGMGNNLWQESGVCVMLWLSLGMASAACHARLEEKREMDDELYGK